MSERMDFPSVMWKDPPEKVKLLRVTPLSFMALEMQESPVTPVTVSPETPKLTFAQSSLRAMVPEAVRSISIWDPETVIVPERFTPKAEEDPV